MLLRRTGNGLISSVLLLSGGTALAQAFTLAVLPFLTRLYSAEDFGVLALFQAIIGILTPLACLCYPLAISLPKNDDDVSSLVQISLLLSGFTSLAMLGSYQLLGPQFHQQLAGLALVGSVAPAATLIIACQQVAQQVATRRRLFRALSIASIAQSVLTGTTSIVMGSFSASGEWLVYIYVTAPLINAAVVWLLVSRSGFRLPLNFFSGNGLSVAARYRDFPLFRAPEQIVHFASLALPAVVLLFYFGVEITGHYAVCRSILQAPVTLVGQSLTTVLYPRFAEDIRNGRSIGPEFRRATIYLAGPGIFGAVLLTLTAPMLFRTLFGANWEGAGAIAQWMGWWMAMELASRPAVAAMPTIELQRRLLLVQFVGLVLRSAAMLVGATLWRDAIAAIALYCAAGAATHILLIITTWRTGKVAAP